jgi:poly(A) polymerase
MGSINPTPLLTGHDLVRHGLEPGPSFALILEKIREAQLEGRIQSKREALEWVDHYIATGSWPDQTDRNGFESPTG